MQHTAIASGLATPALPEGAPPEGAPPFRAIVSSVEELRSVYAPPSPSVVNKQLSRLDQHCRALIALSPFVLVGTADVSGRCDVSPKGGQPGFVQVLDDHRLAWADLPGNRRVDSMQNLLQNPRAGLLFVIPGLEETLRVNGQAWPVRDPEVLERVARGDRRPPVAIGLYVEEAFIHCAKAFRRSGLWQPEAWPDRSGLPSVGCMLRDHTGARDRTPEEIDAGLERNYQQALYWAPPPGVG